jgi:hypothetical protein
MLARQYGIRPWEVDRLSWPELEELIDQAR